MSEDVVATVSSEHGTVTVARGGSVVFGRSGEVDVRIGAAPVYDDVVPRKAGRLFVVEDRLVVENLDDQLAFDLRPENRPLVVVSPGDWHAPSEAVFDIVVTGGVTSYELAVRQNTEHVRTRRVAVDDPQGDLDPPTGVVVELTERQRRILDAYVAPLRDGGLVATHQQVADQLGVSRSLVRVECERIWSAMFLAGVPMRSLGDARDEIVDAWSRHRI